ncbi:uncharacterized protein MONOS_10383 [Monocercomonoides exilis]|uniref:uncharacterized protein n=1 Tax=Monocercomonoides exilis TaxID=2049356 RepID=UPI003559E80F|nr:hypothetical protein MONOS_10383 [Monocercomonoides exilis]|eukprot:MONOS_10383.1-p1 / transcript=MONOS_10383.1 / gene=MONOS_10383 / organism=Monocercomonoides_exilis_PA203 / gene_product=unspecified product / transcript_product=unspecified product / location=Mono_scaffold00470:1136-1930(-) / protein_length=264 / sequence_SO=supercontig / SO=protein_coding / is_pseudo=false
MFNLDETSTYSSDQPPTLVISDDSSSSSPTVPEPAIPTSTTLLLMTSADGDRYRVPIFIPFASVPAEYIAASNQSLFFVPSDTGHMTLALFQKIFFSSFVPDIVAKRAAVGKSGMHALLIMDGGVGHFDENVLKCAKGNLIDVIRLPSHTSHLIQPNDMFVNANLKHSFQKWKLTPSEHTASSIRTNFMQNLKYALSFAFNPKTIETSWRVSGWNPFEPSKVLETLPQSSSEWASSLIKPSKAPSAAVTGAFYYSSDSNIDLLK